MTPDGHVQDRDHKKVKRLGTLWATIGAENQVAKVAAYHYASTKKARGQRPGELGPSDILELRRGITVADADTLFVQQMGRDDVLDCGCNMHARRYFGTSSKRSTAETSGQRRCSAHSKVSTKSKPTSETRVPRHACRRGRSEDV